MVLGGDQFITPDRLPTIIPELQNGSIISVIGSVYHSGALTSSGKLLTWGEYYEGTLGLGDAMKLPAGSPGGYAKEEDRGKHYSYIPRVKVPTEVRFDHGLKAEGRVKRYCFAAAAGYCSTAALVVDLVEDEAPLEGLSLCPQTPPTTFICPW